MSYNPLLYRGGHIRDYRVYDGVFMMSIKDMSQWEVLGGKCSGCQHIQWLDKKAVMARIGNHYLINVARRLRCTRCGNTVDNQVVMGKMDRNA